MCKRCFIVMFSVCLLFSFTSCGGSSSTRTLAVSDIAAQQKTARLNEALVLGAANQQKPLEEGYLIGPEDLLEIEAYNVEELKKTVRVNSQGEIALPLAGILRVKGLTTSETEMLIAKKLDRYVQETVVTVYIKEYKSQRISVVGAVKEPQIFAVTGQRYLIDMLMMAGGLSPEAGNICYVIRKADKDFPGSRSQTIVVDLTELLENGNMTLNVPVFAGDVVNVPKGGLFFVDGAVNTPGAYTIRGKTSLVQAISMAKGVNSVAALGDVRIFRDRGTGERDVIVADYAAIRDGEKPDIPIAENDIIIVPKSDMKNFFQGFVSTLRGFISFGNPF